MVECGRHLNIEILTLSEIAKVSGEAGAYKVTVTKKPRYIDMDKCIACGICSQKCPKKVDDAFNMGIAKRKAAYIQYGQTVPLKYVIDADNCLYFTKGKCRACEKFCPTGAINFEDRQESLTYSVGALILSPGYTPFDPSGLDFYGYDEIPDVVTSLEYERMLSASGPFQGHLEKLSDGREPRKVAWIQCVGSRSTNRCKNGYCSSVCCMYAIKQAVLTDTHLSEGGEQTLFYMDIRTHGKEFERYYESAKVQGVRFIRARPHTIEPGPYQSGVVMTYFTEDGQQCREEFDMAVLSIGMEVSRDALDLAEKTGIDLGAYSFAETGSFNPVASTRQGIYVGGCFQAPMNIPSAVAQASSAAAEASTALVSARGSLTREKTYPPEADVSGQSPRIGVFVCQCGSNIASVIDVDAVVAYAKTLPNVVFADTNMFSCSTDTQDHMAQAIRDENLNRIVIAACSPRTHEPLFQDTLKEAGLNGYLVEMANIRNQNAWVHNSEPEKATTKAKDQVRMAVAKADRQLPLESSQVRVIRKALVIGGGVSGMTAALGLAGQDYDVVLLEKADHLGGNAEYLMSTGRGEPVRPMLEDLIARVEGHEKIEVIKNARLVSASGTVGNFESRVEAEDGIHTIDYGVAVVATGARESVPEAYMYGKDQRIMTHQQMDAAMMAEPERFSEANSAVFIQCVGSRDEKRPYCSRICCTHSVKSAIALKTMNPDMDAFILYRDMRTYGTNEDLYMKARELGVMFIRFDVDDPPDVAIDGGDLLIRVTDPILGRPVAIRADYLFLAAAIEAADVSRLVELYKCATNADGFLSEAHPKLRPVDMAVDGLFLAGLANYPKSLEESIAQGKAAASRAGVILSKDVMLLDALKSYVTDRCDGCALCLDVCPFDAIALEAHSAGGVVHKRVKTEKALCKGCGLCAATCPKGGIEVNGFTGDQLRSQVYAALDLPN